MKQTTFSDVDVHVPAHVDDCPAEFSRAKDLITLDNLGREVHNMFCVNVTLEFVGMNAMSPASQGLSEA